MKKLLLKTFSVIMAIVLLSSQSMVLSAKAIDVYIPSIDESALTLNESAVDQAFAELNNLDNYLNQNAGTTYSDLKSSNSDLLLNVSDNAAPMGMSEKGDLPLGIPSFWWGCILGWVGLLIVYLVTDNDRTEVKSAFKGCLISAGVSVVIYILWWALWAGTAKTIY